MWHTAHATIDILRPIIENQIINKNSNKNFFSESRKVCMLCKQSSNNSRPQGENYSRYCCDKETVKNYQKKFG